MTKSLKVVHLIPFDGVGGVEVAARSLPSGLSCGLAIHKLYLANRQSLPRGVFDHSGPYRSENDLRNFAYSLNWLHRQKPRLLIASLWRSYLITVIYKLLHPNCYVVCFLHCNRAVHWLDRILAWLVMALACEIWTDSRATFSLRIPRQWKAKGRVISFVLQNLKPVSSSRVVPEFLFWGRLAAEKNLDLALNIIALLKTRIPDVNFKVIGPDSGQRPHLERLACNLKLHHNVTFLGRQSHEDILRLAVSGSFYLQSSLFEGVAISVIEAMQLGLVPIVTPVGEISNYCRDDYNSLIIDSLDLELTALRITRLLRDQRLFSVTRDNAIATWASASLYRDDVLTACRAISQLESP